MPLSAGLNISNILTESNRHGNVLTSSIATTGNFRNAPSKKHRWQNQKSKLIITERCIMSEHDWNENDTYYPAEREEIESICSECGSDKMVRYLEANGYDGIQYVYECLNCGATFTE